MIPFRRSAPFARPDLPRSRDFRGVGVLLVLSLANACAPTSERATHSPIGVSVERQMEAHATGEDLDTKPSAKRKERAHRRDNEDLVDEDQEEEADTGSDGTGATNSDKPPRLSKKKSADARAIRLARAALANSASPTNALDLSFAVSQRASDLVWILAIENRSSVPVRLAALPELLTFEVTPKAIAQATPPQKITCKLGELPRKVEKSETVELTAGALLLHEFDPRSYCDHEETLMAGSTVRAMYGFPTNTKKLWRSGKLTTVEVTQKPPFVAEGSSAQDSSTPLIKHLIADEFMLGLTYPLSRVTVLPIQANEESENLADNSIPRPKLALRLSPLSATSAPESHTIQTRIINQSDATIKLFVRRELITYEVVGPQGGFSCHMNPSDRHPAGSEFKTLKKGASTSFKTRLAEACPLGSWRKPGTYFINARLDARSSGKASGIDAFTGTILTDSPTRLIVKGTKKKGRRNAMRVVEKEMSRRD